MNNITFNTTTKLFTLIALALFTFSFTNNTNVLFREWEMGTVKEAAVIYHKPVALFVYSTNCNESKNTFNEFNTSETSKFYNKNFICNKMDATSWEGLIKAQKLGVTSVPTIMFFNEAGKLVHTIKGYQNRTQLLTAAQLAMKVMTETVAKEKASATAKSNNYKTKI